MGNQSYLPRADANLLAFAQNMNAKIAVDPTLWGLSLAQQTAFDSLVTIFASAMATLQDPLTRCTPYVTAKNDARELLINDANGIRKLVDIIQVFPGTTNRMRSEINITIRSRMRTPIPPPAGKPNLTLKGVHGHTVYLSLRDSLDPDRRAKPDGVAGAYIITFIGDDPPQDFAAWTGVTTVTKTTGSVSVPVTSPPLSRVWIAAAWMNAKGQTGPFSTAVSTNLRGGVAAAAA